MPRSQADAFGRIHLPNRMRRAGGRARARRLAARWCRGQVRLTEPALQRAFAGDGQRRVACLQTNPDKTSSPRRMLVVQEHSLVEQMLRDARRLLGRVVVGPQGGLATLVEALHQMLDRSRAQTQRQRDRCGVLALRVARPNLLTHGHGDRLRHSNPPFTQEHRGKIPRKKPSPLLTSAKPHVGIMRKTTCRVTPIADGASKLSRPVAAPFKPFADGVLSKSACTTSQRAHRDHFSPTLH